MGWSGYADGSFTWLGGFLCSMLCMYVDPSGATGGEGQAGKEVGGKGIRAVLCQKSVARGKTSLRDW